MKTRKVAEKTLYCLSPEELLQTAEEVLEEVQCENDATFYYQFVLRQLSIFFFPFCWPQHRCSLPDCGENAPEQSKQHSRKHNPEGRTKRNTASTNQLSQGSSSRYSHERNKCCHSNDFLLFAESNVTESAFIIFIWNWLSWSTGRKGFDLNT